MGIRDGDTMGAEKKGSTNWRKAELSQKDAEQALARCVALEKEVGTLVGSLEASQMTAFANSYKAELSQKDAEQASAWSDVLEKGVVNLRMSAFDDSQKAKLSQKDADQASTLSVALTKEAVLDAAYEKGKACVMERKFQEAVLIFAKVEQTTVGYRNTAI